jgi:hypothetical protein
MNDFKNQKLKESFHKYVDELVAAFDDYPWDNKEAYAWWLSQTYYFVRHTTVLLSLAAAKFGHQSRARHYATFHHIREEMNHDLMPLDDLKGLGTDISKYPELEETSAFYQSQYYFVQQVHPVALYGYALALEGLASKKLPALYERLKKLYGEKAVKFIKVHGVVDQDHFEQGLEDFKDITDEEADYVSANLNQSAHMYLLMLKRIQFELRKKGNSAA